MNAIKVADLKAHLSAYLRLVRGGRTLIIADRQTPIAKMVPIHENPKIDLGVIKATKPPSSLKDIRYVKPAKDFDPLEALRAERERG